MRRVIFIPILIFLALAAIGGEPFIHVNADTIWIDGVNVLPAVATGEPPPERPLFWEMDGQTAMRRGRWLVPCSHITPSVLALTVISPRRGRLSALQALTRYASIASSRRPSCSRATPLLPRASASFASSSMARCAAPSASTARRRSGRHFRSTAAHEAMCPPRAAASNIAPA